MLFFLVAVSFVLSSCGNNQSFSDFKVQSREAISQQTPGDNLDGQVTESLVEDSEINDAELEAEEEITAEIPIIISGSYLSCNIVDPNQPSVLVCKYSGGSGAFTDGQMIMSEGGLNIRVGNVNAEEQTIIIEIIEEEIKPTPSTDKEETNETQTTDEQQESVVAKNEGSEVEETKQGPEVTSAQYSSLPFELEMSYMQYPMYDSDTKAGFLGDIELLTYLGGGEISVVCKTISDDKEVFSSEKIRLKRDPNNILTDLLAIDFIKQDQGTIIEFSNLEDTVCEVSVDLYSGLEGVGIDIERMNEDAPDFFGLVFLNKEGIDLERLEAKSFSHNIECISSFDDVCD